MSAPDAPFTLDIGAVLAAAPSEARAAGGLEIGRSREGRPIHGHRLGSGPLRVSLIAGCHADEPVGPAMLDRLVAVLAHPAAGAPLRDLATLSIVPHVNPDGEARNRPWTDSRASRAGRRDAYDLGRYLRGAVREAPGDDVEFGFPTGPDDLGARPENRAVAAFLAPGAPYDLHGSFHGMAFAAGPWFLLEAAWAERTAAMRERVRAAVAALGYTVHDVDRGGEKGFSRIDRGFTTRPDSRAMRAHFEALGDPETARRFRPSSMEHVRALGGDPLTLVSEMPLFLLPAACYRDHPLRPPVLAELFAAAGDDDALRRAAGRIGVRAMPIDHQMRLQLAYLEAALQAVGAHRTRSPPHPGV